MKNQAAFITQKAKRDDGKADGRIGIVTYKNKGDILPLVEAMQSLGWGWKKQTMELKRDGYLTLCFKDSHILWNIISGSRICLGVILEGAWEDGVHNALRARLRDPEPNVVDTSVYVLSEYGVVTLTHEFQMWEDIVCANIK